MRIYLLAGFWSNVWDAVSPVGWIKWGARVTGISGAVSEVIANIMGDLQQWFCWVLLWILKFALQLFAVFEGSIAALPGYAAQAASWLAFIDSWFPVGLAIFFVVVWANTSVVLAAIRWIVTMIPGAGA